MDVASDGVERAIGQIGRAPREVGGDEAVRIAVLAPAGRSTTKVGLSSASRLARSAAVAW